jgi:hypothetical protein
MRMVKGVEQEREKKPEGESKKRVRVSGGVRENGRWRRVVGSA